jgi:hypothetical protein
MLPRHHASSLPIAILTCFLITSCGSEDSGGGGGPGDGISDELPNLRVGTMSSAPGGAESEGRVEVQNNGEADAGGFDVEFWFEESAGELGDQGDVTLAVDSLAAGDSVWLEATLSGRRCLVSAYLDSQGDVDESDESDNSGEVDGCGR